MKTRRMMGTEKYEERVCRIAANASLFGYCANLYHAADCAMDGRTAYEMAKNALNELDNVKALSESSYEWLCTVWKEEVKEIREFVGKMESSAE